MINSCFCMSCALAVILTSWLWIPFFVITSPIWILSILCVYLTLKFCGFWGKVLRIQFEIYEWFMFRSNKPRKYLWKKFYNFINWQFPSDEWQNMNLGYASYTESGKTLELSEDLENERFAYQLYEFLFTGFIEIKGKNVLVDVGCGRGAGLKFLHVKHQIDKSIGLDFSSKNVQFCKKYNSLSGIQFVLADAEKMPLEDCSVDIVICVESSHCFGNFKGVLGEIERILKPKGVFLLADFVGNADKEEYEENFKNFLKLESRKDVSENVLTALKLDTARRVELIEKRAPFLLQRLMMRVAGIEGSTIYNQLEAGDTIYVAYHFTKE